MDTFDSRRSTVPARLAAQRPVVPATIRQSGGLPEAATPSPLSLRVALRGARRYWWLVLMLWVVGSAGIGAVVYLKVRPTYRATSFLRVDPWRPTSTGSAAPATSSTRSSRPRSS